MSGGGSMEHILAEIAELRSTVMAAQLSHRQEMQLRMQPLAPRVGRLGNKLSGSSAVRVGGESGLMRNGHTFGVGGDKVSGLYWYSICDVFEMSGVMHLLHCN
jgi:hypothetical protein